MPKMVIKTNWQICAWVFIVESSSPARPMAAAGQWDGHGDWANGEASGEEDTSWKPPSGLLWVTVA
jgi:hypothetical protein